MAWFWGAFTVKPGVWPKVFEIRCLNLSSCIKPGVWNQVSETRCSNQVFEPRPLKSGVWNQVFETSCLKPGVKLVKPRSYNSFWRNTVLLREKPFFLSNTFDNKLFFSGNIHLFAVGLEFLFVVGLIWVACFGVLLPWNQVFESRWLKQVFELKCLNPGVWNHVELITLL